MSRSRQQSEAHLLVTLRPTGEAESIVIDLAARRIGFAGADRLFGCTKCRRFISRDLNRALNRHTRAAHDSLAPSNRRILGVRLLRQTQLYRGHTLLDKLLVARRSGNLLPERQRFLILRERQSIVALPFSQRAPPGASRPSDYPLCRGHLLMTFIRFRPHSINAILA